MSKKTVFITGCSSGIGKTTAEYFLEKGWNAAITVRKEKDKQKFTPSDSLEIFLLDVTDTKKIPDIVDKAIQQFGTIDVVVNNAGYGLFGPFESSTDEQIMRELQTNLLGVIAITRAFLPHFKKNRNGRYITMASMFSHISMPFFTYYATSKWAVEAFTESIWYEVKDFGIQVKLIEPGSIKTDFFTRSIDIAKNVESSDNKAYFERVHYNLTHRGDTGEPAINAAKMVYKAATENSWRLRYVVDKTAKYLLALRRILPVELFLRGMKANI